MTPDPRMTGRHGSPDRPGQPDHRNTMTTAAPTDRPRRERSLSRSGTKSPDDTRCSHATGWQANDAAGSSDTEHAEVTIETDGGRTVRDEDDTAFRTYTDSEYGYSVAYPADWSVESDSGGGATFETSRSAAGAAVFVEEHGLSPVASAAAFLDELAADEHIRALEPLAQRDTRLQSGQTGRIIECTYVGDSCDQWRLMYLFARRDDTGYTLGIDWDDATGLDAMATMMVKSFALKAT